MKIIFLDIDGVLNSQDWFRRRIPCKPDADRDEFIHNQLDPIAISRFKKLIEDTGAAVVLSSTWRRWEDDRRILNERGITWIDCTPHFPGELRGKEIEAWLDENELEVERYCILDDDSDMLEHQPLFQTSNKIGLTQGMCDRIKEYFSKT